MTAETSASGDADPIGALLFPKTPDFNLPPVQPRLDMFLWTLILFGGFIFVMRGAVWKPLIVGIDSREARVINTEYEAEAAKREVESLKHEAEARLAEVQSQVKALIAEARAEAESEKRQIVAQAEAAAQRIKETALQELLEAQNAAIQSLDQLVEEQVALATEHVVGRRL